MSGESEGRPEGWLEGIDGVGAPYKRAPWVDYSAVDGKPADKAPAKPTAAPPPPPFAYEDDGDGRSAGQQRREDLRMGEIDPDDPRVLEYQLPSIPGVEFGEMDHALHDRVRAKAASLNIPPEALQQLVTEFVTATNELQSDEFSGLFDDEGMISGGEREMRAEWGQDFDKNLAAAHKVIEHFGDAKLRRAFGKLVPGTGHSLGDFPPLLRLLSKVGRQLPHDSLPQEWGGGRSDAAQLHSPQSKKAAKARIDQIYAEHPAGSPGYKSAAVQAELRRLFAMLD